MNSDSNEKWHILLEDMSTYSQRTDGYAKGMLKLQKLLSTANVSYSNIDYRYLYEKLLTDITLRALFANFMQLNPSLVLEESLKDSQDVLKVYKDSCLEFPDISSAYEELLAQLDLVTAKIRLENPISSTISPEIYEKFFVLFNQGERALIERKDVLKATFATVFNHIDLLTILKILSNRDKKIFCFVGLAHVYKVIDALKDEYETIYSSLVKFRDESEDKIFDVNNLAIKIMDDILLKPVDQKDFDYMNV